MHTCSALYPVNAHHRDASALISPRKFSKGLLSWYFLNLSLLPSLHCQPRIVPRVWRQGGTHVRIYIFGEFWNAFAHQVQSHVRGMSGALCSPPALIRDHRDNIDSTLQFCQTPSGDPNEYSLSTLLACIPILFPPLLGNAKTI